MAPPARLVASTTSFPGVIGSGPFYRFAHSLAWRLILRAVLVDAQRNSLGLTKAMSRAALLCLGFKRTELQKGSRLDQEACYGLVAS